ncbi:amino acid/amide ABC transporter substrate-binding protein (HAAT family) [Rhizobium sp. 57MFTsu3.2]|nr:amino acid/amide ABC transporter substrate-binding protein (HAAT family) [Rhizobium sp. 57MFTsu3.2]
MRRTLLTIIGSIMLPGLLLAHEVDPTKAPVLVGQLVSRTGNNPGGLDNEQGAALAVKEINVNGGVLGGRRIELRLADDRTDPESAVRAFAELKAQSVSAVVGTSFSNASLAVIPSVEDAQIPYVSTGAAEAQIIPVRSYVFMTPLTGRLVGEKLLRYMQAAGFIRVTAIYDADSLFGRTGWATQKEMLARYGIELVEEHSVHVNTQDFSTLLEKIDANKPQAIMAWLTGPPAIAFGKAYAESSRTVPVLMPHGIVGPAFLHSVGAGADGIIAAAPLTAVAADMPEGEVKSVASQMVGAFRNAYGHAPSQFALDGYVAVRLIAAAIDNAGSSDPSAIRDALERVKVQTPQGRYAFTATNHSGLSIEDVTITRISGGQFKLLPWSACELAGQPCPALATSE